jgi:WD40 repeat protein
VAIFLADGRLVTGGEDGRVRVWDGESATDLPLPGTPSDVLGLGESPDGAYVAGAVRGNTLAVWDARTLTLLRAVRDMPLTAWSPAFAPDSRRLLTGSFGGAVLMLEPLTSDRVRVLTGHAQFAVRVMFSPQGDIAVSLGADGTLNVWDPVAGQCIASLTGCGQEVLSACWAPGRRVAVGYKSGEVEVWDLGYYDRFIRGNAPYHAAALAKDPATAPLGERLGRWARER